MPLVLILFWIEIADGYSDAYTVCFLINTDIIFVTKILPFHPVTDSKNFGPIMLLTQDWTVRVVHCSVSLRSCTSARYFLTGHSCDP